MNKSDDSEIQVVHVNNASDCAGDASDGSMRAIWLFLIFLVLIFIAIEVRTLGNMYRAVNGKVAEKAYEPTRNLYSAIADAFSSDEEE